jgi:hypothetical protein
MKVGFFQCCLAAHNHPPRFIPNPTKFPQMIDIFWTKRPMFLVFSLYGKSPKYCFSSIFFGHENYGIIFLDFGLQSRQSAPGFLSSSSNWALPITFPPDECVSPLGPKGGERTRPIPTKGQTLWYSIYSINLPEGKKRRHLKTTLMCCFTGGFFAGLGRPPCRGVRVSGHHTGQRAQQLQLHGSQVSAVDEYESLSLVTVADTR